MASANVDRERWLALALLLAALGVAYLLLVHPWWTAPILQVNAELDESRGRELRVRTQLQQAPEIEKQLAAASAQLAQRPGFLAESSAELATAGLVKRLETVVLAASPGNRSCAINNRSPMPQAASNEPFAAVVVQVRLQCGTPELAAVLHALESGTPRLFIDNLNVLTLNYAFQSATGGTTNNGLDVSFDLYGYLRPLAGASVATDTAAPAVISEAQGMGDAN